MLRNYRPKYGIIKGIISIEDEGELANTMLPPFLPLPLSTMLPLYSMMSSPLFFLAIASPAKIVAIMASESIANKNTPLNCLLACIFDLLCVLFWLVVVMFLWTV